MEARRVNEQRQLNISFEELIWNRFERGRREYKQWNSGPAPVPTSDAEQTNCWTLIDTPLSLQTAGSEDVESF